MLVEPRAGGSADSHDGEREAEGRPTAVGDEGANDTVPEHFVQSCLPANDRHHFAERVEEQGVDTKDEEGSCPTAVVSPVYDVY